MSNNKVIVVGGGLVGAAIAYGIARKNTPVVVLDQGDTAFRASRGNFGLVWVQGKGSKQPRYAMWSKEAALQWPALSEELMSITGIDVGLRQPGGFWIGFSHKEMETRQEVLARLDRNAGGIPHKLMDRAELSTYLPGLGPTVAGGSFCSLDGHANPLKTLHALHLAIQDKGGEIISNVSAVDTSFDCNNRRFTVTTDDRRIWTGDRLVLAAGLGVYSLAPKVGLFAPVFAQKGQVLITERLKHFLDDPTNKFRQTVEGSIQVGSTSEDVGEDDRSTNEGIEKLARRAVATFPRIGDANLVRAWGALRIKTEDGLPIYDESLSCPGAFVVTSHSGVTLAPLHSFIVGSWIAGQAEKPKCVGVFSSTRFRTCPHKPD